MPNYQDMLNTFKMYVLHKDNQIKIINFEDVIDASKNHEELCVEVVLNDKDIGCFELSNNTITQHQTYVLNEYVEMMDLIKSKFNDTINHKKAA